jgi:hypothetical protein
VVAGGGNFLLGTGKSSNCKGSHIFGKRSNTKSNMYQKIFNKRDFLIFSAVLTA